mmetsp:Transcript_26586/g.44516  ORF Transcript_26586/g.44516 Transcript_26586/m.44516 type:complete len:269 (+) Transcript_26586:545-1351(+)
MLTCRNRRRLAVELEDAIGAFKRMLAHVQRSDVCGTPTRGIHREPSRETERVEDARAPRHLLHPFPIVSLIEKETCFLATDDISFEDDAVLEERYGRGDWRAEQHLAVAQLELFLRDVLAVAAEAQHDASRGESAGHRGHHFLQMRQPGRGVHLHNKAVVISIHNKAWKPVTFAVDPAVAIGRVIKQRLSFLHGFLHFHAPKVRVDGERRPLMKHAYAKRGLRVVQANSEEALAFIENHRELSCCAFLAHLRHAIAIHPWVTLTNGFL